MTTSPACQNLVDLLEVRQQLQAPSQASRMGHSLMSQASTLDLSINMCLHPYDSLLMLWEGPQGALVTTDTAFHRFVAGLEAPQQLQTPIPILTGAQTSNPFLALLSIIFSASSYGQRFILWVQLELLSSDSASFSQRLVESWMLQGFESCAQVYVLNALLFELAGFPSLLTLSNSIRLCQEDSTMHAMPLLGSLMRIGSGLLYCTQLSSFAVGSLAVNGIVQVSLGSLLGVNPFTFAFTSGSWWLIKAVGCFYGGSFMLAYGP